EPTVRQRSAAQFCEELSQELQRLRTNQGRPKQMDLAEPRQRISALLPFSSEPSEESEAETLRQIEGVWNADIGTTFCFRVVDGILRCAYSYGGRETLRAHLLDCVVLGDQVMSRFRWILQPDIQGYLYYRHILPGTLMGGWCYKDEAPLGPHENL